MSQSQHDTEDDYEAADALYRASFSALQLAERARRVAYNRRLDTTQGCETQLSNTRTTQERV